MAHRRRLVGGFEEPKEQGFGEWVGAEAPDIPPGADHAAKGLGIGRRQGPAGRVGRPLCRAGAVPHQRHRPGPGRAGGAGRHARRVAGRRRAGLGGRYGRRVSRARFAFLDHPGPIAFAHRGGALEAPENTWEAFRAATALGYHYIETDVHATSDGVVVTIHDPDLARTSERAGLVREMSWADLSGVRLAGSEEPVPRLDDVLAAWPELRWNIDAKHDSVVGPLIETIHRAGALDRVCITSFSDRRLARIRRALGPRLCAGMGPAATTVLRAVSLLPAGAGRFAGQRLTSFGAAQVPVRQGRLPLVDRRFLDTAHALGLQVHIWTVDDAATMERLLDLGADGIMTDRPSALKEVLVRRRLWV
jgi:glycerophosphoryl diester phosphodiesterase